MGFASNRIRELREAQGLTQAELARRVGVTPPALHKIEVGARKLDQEWMRKVAAALGCGSAELLPPEDNPLALSPEEWEVLEKLMARVPHRARDELTCATACHAQEIAKDKQG